jgi:hypothetical protein
MDFIELESQETNQVTDRGIIPLPDRVLTAPS